ncbi:Protein-S-isoprenylcysteine O-methyltransferase [Drechslerella dactyloides]|uniref:Protein-S-isoprenylcysteine O-methyltransferase n=1 Tax=Drechslerella dactyloides TaxID=74499 RepID=A0AAD6NM30_DREDA|nr:Protein-S-isoprenylcysteine O-methyltransferase [Drechslerella dactyloides]
MRCVPATVPFDLAEWLHQLHPFVQPSLRAFVTPQTQHSMSDSDEEITPFFPRIFLPGESYALDGIAIRAQLLGLTSGLTFASAIALYLHDSAYHLPLFILFLSIFHFLEFYITARYNTRRATIGSFLFQNGREYTAAHTLAAVEYLLEYALHTRVAAPPLPLFLTGLALILVGQTLRSLAMIHASTSFNHHVAYRKEVDHKLITTGVYAWIRHPSYLGFWLWGLGTQVMLGNPVCFVGYAAVLWRFFSRRIAFEEDYLVRFFGKRYIDYRNKTRVWIPFIP